VPDPEEPPPIELVGGVPPGLLIWQDGRYTLQNSAGATNALDVSGLDGAIHVEGPWRVNFPPGLGAPSEITLPRLSSLHRHFDSGVRYFSGTATYRARFDKPRQSGGGERLYLDLGRVEVIADVRLNGRNIGLLWKPPYRADITEAVGPAENELEVLVTNLWPNRLIGDEQFPPDYTYGDIVPSGPASAGATGGIKELPEWFVQGRPRPPSRRVAFTTWKHYTKDSPLLESGLLGPVRLRRAVRRAIES
jgi:hypothetical protein